MNFGSTAKAVPQAECKLKYHRISECSLGHSGSWQQEMDGVILSLMLLPWICRENGWVGSVP